MEIPGLHIRAPDGNDPLTLILYNWERLSGLPTGEPFSLSNKGVSLRTGPQTGVAIS